MTTEKKPANFHRELKDNPIWASLLLLNPALGLSHFGFETSELEAKKNAIGREDERRAALLLEENFQVKKPQIIQNARNEGLLASPRISANSFERESDISLTVSREVLKYSLKRFSKNSFTGKKFTHFLSDDWWSLNAVGESVKSELGETGITLMIDFQCELAINLDEFKAEKIKFPLGLKIVPAFAVSGTQLYLSISKGQISISNFFLPINSAENLANVITGIIPYIPLCTIPTQFNVPDNEPDPDVLLTDALLDENGIQLSFHIDEDFVPAAKIEKPVKRKKAKGAAASLPDIWIGQKTLWSYDNYLMSDETIAKSCGNSVMATIADFFGRNPFTLEPKGEPTPDGRDHYDSQEFVGKFYDWYYPRFSTIGESAISAREDIIRAFSNLKFGYKEFSGNETKAQKLLIEWIINKKLPVVVLLDMGKLTVLENIATGENEARVQEFVAHWGVVYAVNDTGVKLATWGNDYFVSWEIFMSAWSCDFLPQESNFYQIQVWDK